MSGAYLGLSVVANPRSKDRQCHVTETRPTGGRGVAKKKDFAEGELHALPSPFAIASSLLDFLFWDPPLGETAVGCSGLINKNPTPRPGAIQQIKLHALTERLH